MHTLFKMRIPKHTLKFFNVNWIAQVDYINRYNRSFNYHFEMSKTRDINLCTKIVRDNTRDNSGNIRNNDNNTRDKSCQLKLNDIHLPRQLQRRI